MNWPPELPPISEKERQQAVIIATKKNLKHNDKKVKTQGNEIQVGDIVFVRNRHRSSAEDRCIQNYLLKYVGPYIVIGVGKNSVDLITPENEDAGKHALENVKLYKCSQERKADIMKKTYLA